MVRRASSCNAALTLRSRRSSLLSWQQWRIPLRPGFASARHARSSSSFPCSSGSRMSTAPRVPCASDGELYSVRGHVVAPKRALSAPRRALTIYVSGGVLSGETTWRFPVPGYDHARAMAQRGHASLVIDRLGWGSSDIPNGS
jgi:hypothetical protein